MKKGRRVVVTGMGLRSPIGAGLADFSHGLQSNACGIYSMPDWEKIDKLRTRLAGRCPEAQVNEMDLPRKHRRGMGRIGVLAALATKDAIADSGLKESLISSKACGISYGSTAGSSSAMEEFLKKVFERSSIKGSKSTSYLKFMSHTCAANLGIMFGSKGPLIASCTACTSGSQAIGFGFQTIKEGRADIMLTGGAEENHYMNAVVFDIMLATSSKYNDRPDQSPRPFDVDRDGLVVSEGAGTLVLEEYGHAKRRGADIHAEILGYATNCDGAHLTSPDPAGIESVMKLALDDAGLDKGKIQYLCAHATATPLGDVAESRALFTLFGGQIPVSSLKGHMGHTLGACGALESIATILMIKEGFLAPTRNLETVDPELAPLDYVKDDPRSINIAIAMNNNFAFGGINTSLIFRKI